MPPNAQVRAEAVKRRDLPLHGHPHPYDRLHPALYAAELSGTALLVSIGLSVVIALWGRGSPLAALLTDLGLRRAVNGFLFGGVAALIALSPLGRISGAHINPAVTLAFWLEGKIAWRDAGCYVVAQFLGAALGALPLLAWGAMGHGVDFGATLPEAGVPIWWPLLGEAGCTFLLVVVIFVTAAHPPLHPFAAPSNAPLFCLLVWLEGSLSGASANPARSFGPDLVAGLWQGQWIYAAGPCLGAALAVAVLRLEVIGRHRPHAARRHHIGIDALPPS